MKHSTHRKALVVALSGLTGLVALSAVSARSLPSVEADHRTDQTAEELYAQAPAGVDPMVTGPVSSEFRQKQRRLGCEAAVWPHVPTACYPD